MNARSNQPEVRNPVLRLASADRLLELPPPAREALRLVLLDISKDARSRAEKSWRTHKGAMAMYWKAVAVYARHCASVLRKKNVDAVIAEAGEK